MAVTLESLGREVAETRKQMKLIEGIAGDITAQLARPASKALRGGAALAWGPQQEAWPQERLERIAKSFDPMAAWELSRKDYRGHTRGSGFAGHLKALAVHSGFSAPGMPPGSVSREELEKKWSFRHSSHEKAALAESAGVTGGYTIPPDFKKELLTIAGEDDFFEPRARVLPMASLEMEFPVLDITTNQGTGITPYAGGVIGYWTPEATQLTESEPAFRMSKLVANALTIYAVASNQMLQDNGIGLDAWLTQIFSWAITWFKTYAFLQGIGAGNQMPLGILYAPATYVQNRTSPNAFKLADAAAMFAHLNWRSWGSSCWIMHQSVLPQLIQMFANGSSGDRLVWLSPMGSDVVGGAVAKFPMVFLNGLPIFFTEKVPKLGTKGDVMLCDLSQYIVGNRLDIQIDVSPHVLFKYNQMAWRVVLRTDGKPWLNSVITDAAGWVNSPFIVLN